MPFYSTKNNLQRCGRNVLRRASQHVPFGVLFFVLGLRSPFRVRLRKRDEIYRGKNGLCGKEILKKIVTSSMIRIFSS